MRLRCHKVKPNGILTSLFFLSKDEATDAVHEANHGKSCFAKNYKAPRRCLFLLFIGWGNPQSGLRLLSRPVILSLGKVVSTGDWFSPGVSNVGTSLNVPLSEVSVLSSLSSVLAVLGIVLGSFISAELGVLCGGQPFWDVGLPRYNLSLGKLCSCSVEAANKK